MQHAMLFKLRVGLVDKFSPAQPHPAHLVIDLIECAIRRFGQSVID
jgi:hypothetical protein